MTLISKKRLEITLESLLISEISEISGKVFCAAGATYR